MSAAPKVGIVGVGRVGLAVAKRLAAEGFEVAAFDVDPARFDALAGTGARRVAATDAWTAGDFVLLALADDAQTQAALDAAGALIRPGTIIVDLHTGDPRLAERTADRCAAMGVAYLDAPLAGSIAQIERGDAVALIGGHPEAIARCDELWPALARERFVLGGAGCGHRAKLAFALVLGLNRAALAEGIAFAEALGLDGPTFVEVLRATPAYSRAVDSKGSRMATRNYAPDATVRMQRRDVGLILEVAAQAGGELPLARAFARLLDDGIAAGEGDLDGAAIVETLRRMLKR